LSLYRGYPYLKGPRCTVPRDTAHGRHTVGARGYDIGSHAIGEQSAWTFFRQPETDGGSLDGLARFIRDLDCDAAAVSRACRVNSALAFGNSNMEKRLTFERKA
jgi:hypothetical protein